MLFQRAVRELPASQLVKLVGLILATFMDRDGVAWPSMDALARCAGCAPRSVRRALRQLEAAGLLVCERSPGRRPNRYRASVPNPDTAVSGLAEGQPGHWTQPTRTLGASNPDTAGAPEVPEGSKEVAGASDTELAAAIARAGEALWRRQAMRLTSQLDLGQVKSSGEGEGDGL